MATFQELMRIAELTVKDKTSSKRMGEILSILKKHDGVLNGDALDSVTEALVAADRAERLAQAV